MLEKSLEIIQNTSENSRKHSHCSSNMLEIAQKLGNSLASNHPTFSSNSLETIQNHINYPQCSSKSLETKTD